MLKYCKNNGEEIQFMPCKNFMSKHLRKGMWYVDSIISTNPPLKILSITRRNVYGTPLKRLDMECQTINGQIVQTELYSEESITTVNPI